METIKGFPGRNKLNVHLLKRVLGVSDADSGMRDTPVIICAYGDDAGARLAGFCDGARTVAVCYFTARTSVDDIRKLVAERWVLNIEGGDRFRNPQSFDRTSCPVFPEEKTAVGRSGHELRELPGEIEPPGPVGRQVLIQRLHVEAVDHEASPA